MPDITMCEGGECPKKENCYRHTVEPNPWRQSYFVEPPYKDSECEYFVCDGSSKKDSEK